jgi:hypothetical protein
LPEEIEPLLRALFGPTTSDRHAAARRTLREAFQIAWAEKQAVAMARAKPDRAGSTWVIENDVRFVMDRITRPSDRRAAADPLRQQLQDAIHEIAGSLVLATARLANSAVWGRLPIIANRFHATVDGDPQDMPNRLGEAYALMLGLGRFLETDQRLRVDRSASDDPLDADVHGLLTDLVRTAAPWLRGFPTVAAWDNAAGKALVREELFRPTRQFARIAYEERTISRRDAAEIEALADVAHAVDYLGKKAAARAVGDTKNLLIAIAELAAMALSGISPPARSDLARRAGATLATAEPEIVKLAGTLPGDLGHSLRALAGEGRRLASTGPVSAPPETAMPVPKNIEEQAVIMILDGCAPPANWRSMIRSLKFDEPNLRSIDLLAELTALEHLVLWDTNVRDLTILSSLSKLSTLDLDGTKIVDISPIASLTALQSLSLTGTKVRDISPLISLKRLTYLGLSATQVRNISVVRELENLEELDISRTQVQDVSPLAGLQKLRFLNIYDARVVDTSMLSQPNLGINSRLT